VGLDVIQNGQGFLQVVELGGERSTFFGYVLAEFIQVVYDPDTAVSILVILGIRQSLATLIRVD